MTSSTSPEKVAAQWYQMRLANEAVQAAQMFRDRELLRRGARKMQDGKLGTPETPPAEEEDMQVRIGDEVHYHQNESAAAAARPASAASTLTKRALPLALAAALGGGAGALPWLVPALLDRPEVEETDYTDRDTQYLLELVEPESG